MKTVFKALLLICLFVLPAYSAGIVPYAEDIETDTANFNNNLSSADTDTQKALDTLDNLSVTGHGDGANCSAGNYPLGVDANGVAQSCTADSDTQLTQEQVEDYAGSLVSNATGTHTGVSITYQDATGDMDFIVDHDAALNFDQNEHFLQSAITETGTIATGVWQGSAIVDAYIDNSVNWNAAFTHVGSDGSSHTFLDQSVISGASPTFSATNFSDGGSNAIITTTQETNFETAYTHSQDNSQAHSDYLLNTTDQMDGNLTIDNTATEALLVRKNADAGDVFAVDTTNQKITFTGDPTGARTNIVEAYGYGGQKFFQLTTGDGVTFPDRVFIGNDFSGNPGTQTFGVFASGSATSAFQLTNTMTSSEAFNAQTMLLVMDIAKTDFIGGNVISSNTLLLSGAVDETSNRNFGGTKNTFQIKHPNTIDFTGDAFGYASNMTTSNGFTGATKFDDWTDFLVKAGSDSGTAGTLTFGNKIGLYIENSVAFDGIDNLIGIKIDKLTTGTNNYGIMLNGDGTGADLVLGAGQDAKIYYDGTNLIIDPKVVGTGYVSINGSIKFNDNTGIRLGTAPTGDATIYYNGTDLIINPQLVGSGHVILNSPKTTTGDPVGGEGKIYWNTIDNVIKMYADGAWRTITSW